MKKVVFVVLVALSTLISCNKDEDNQIIVENLTKETISAKWLVDNTSTYQSLEFNKSGNYIIVKNTGNSTNPQEILFGTYQIDESTLVLSDFGNIEVIDISDESIRLSIDSDKINATKKVEMNSSTRTDLLCKTWKSVTRNGIPVEGTDGEFSVIFSAAGTYFISYTNVNYQFLAEWEWNDASETIFLYSHGEASGSAEITELDINNLEVTEYGDVTNLVPLF